MYYLYILKLRNGSLYTGITGDVKIRLQNHRNGSGSKYVYSRLPFVHIYTAEFRDKKSAVQREKQIKGWRREKKMRILGLRY